MRRLNRNDDGITIVVVTIAMTALLLMGALALDVGKMYFNRARAQNSADAQAIAGAINCVGGELVTAAPLPTLKPNQTLVPDPDGCGGGEVKVHVTQPQDFQFVPKSILIDEDATATWGALGQSIGLFPITVGSCTFTGLAQNVKVTLHSYAVPGCSTPSGNFGFVANGCTNTQTVLVGNDMHGTTGNNFGGTGCSNFNSYLGRDVLIPVWDTESGSGFGGTYHVQAFALFHLTGWSTNGGSNHGGTLGNQCDASADDGEGSPIGPDKNKPCIRGWFKGYTTTGVVIAPGVACGPASLNPLITCLVRLVD